MTSRSTDVYVTGGSLPALVAALDLAEVGLSVEVALTDSDADRPSEPIADPEQSLTPLMRRLAEPLAENGRPDPGSVPSFATREPVLLEGATGAFEVQPTPDVLGIPAVPMSAESLALIGSGAGFRAYLDRLQPLLTIGKTRDLAKLVRARMGRSVLERLVEPIVWARYGRPAAEVEVAIAAPGLNEIMTRTGSLGGAVLAYAERHVARETGVIPSAGWTHLIAAIRTRLELYGATFSEAPITRLVGDETSGWTVTLGAHDEVRARAVVVDCGRFLRPSSIPTSHLEGEGRRLARQRFGAEIEVPDWWPAGEARAVLRTVAAADGKTWSVRVSPGESERWTAQFTGPMLEESAVGEVNFAELLAAAELRALESGALRVDTVAAPFATHDEREQSPTLHNSAEDVRFPVVRVGERLHGDDLSAAVAAAHTAAIETRRMLTGIAG